MKSTPEFRIKLLLCLFFLVSLGSNAQQNADLIMGDRFFDKFEFADALYYYELVYDQQPNDPAITRRIGDTYRRMGQVPMSAEYYRKTLEIDVSQPDDMLHYAEALKCLQEYDEAIEWFGRYNSQVPNDRRVKSHLKDPYYYRDLQADSLKYVMKKLDVNTADPAIGVCRFEKGQYFISSMRLETPTPEEKKKWEKELPYLDVYLCDLSENDDLIHPLKLDKSVNSKYHDGPVFYCEKDHTLYITRNNIRNGKPVRDKKGNVNLKIYSSTINEGIWEPAEELKFNEDNFSNGHPCLTRDGNFMYFVSNQDGGFGGTDIYLSQRVGETWTDPINLGPNINTEGDEMFPYIASNGALYFASNGWAGLGGLDVFRSDLSAGKWAEPVNLGYPINSSQDDFGILYNNNDDSGFFCSNRDGNGNDDVFFFNTINLMKMILAGVIQSPEPGKSLAGEKILITSAITGKVSESRLNDKEEFSFQADPGDRIEVRLASDDYVNGEAVISYDVPTQVNDPFANIGTYYATPGKMDPKNAGFANGGDKNAVLNRQDLPVNTKSDVVIMEPPVAAVAAHGIVVDGETQNVIAFATVTYTGSDGKEHSVMTDEKGKFTITDNVPSKINIKIDKLEYLSCKAEVVLSDNPNKMSPTKVRMERPFVPMMVEVTGIVNGEKNAPLKGVVVTCLNADGSKVSAITDSKGKYTLKTFEQKGAIFSFDKDDYEIDSQTIDIVAAIPLNANGKTRPASGMTRTTDLAIDVKGTILSDDNSQPLKDVIVTCKNSDGTATIAITDANGNYSLKTFKQYDAFFTFEKDGFLLGSKTADVTDESIVGVILNASLARSNGNIVTMTGTVTDPDTQRPVGSATIIFKSEDGSVIETIADELGRYSLNVNSNMKGKLTVEKDGYEVSSTDVDTSTGENGALRLNVTLRLADVGQGSASINTVKKRTDYEHVVDLHALSIDNVLFDYDKSYIREDAKPTLDQVKSLMELYPTSILIISTHSDSRGSVVYNQQLSMSRAMSVKGYLLKKGIDPARMRIEYFGETKPLNGCTDDIPCNEQEYEMNRRAEFMLVSEISANKK